MASTYAQIQARRARYRAAGLCAACGKHPLCNETMCERCRDKDRARSAKRRERDRATKPPKPAGVAKPVAPKPTPRPKPVTARRHKQQPLTVKPPKPQAPPSISWWLNTGTFYETARAKFPAGYEAPNPMGRPLPFYVGMGR